MRWDGRVTNTRKHSRRSSTFLPPMQLCGTGADALPCVAIVDMLYPMVPVSFVQCSGTVTLTTEDGVVTRWPAVSRLLARLSPALGLAGRSAYDSSKVWVWAVCTVW